MKTRLCNRYYVKLFLVLYQKYISLEVHLDQRISQCSSGPNPLALAMKLLGMQVLRPQPSPIEPETLPVAQ